MTGSIKRVLGGALAVVLIISICLMGVSSVQARGGNRTISSNTTFSDKFNEYDNLTIKKNVTLTMADLQPEPVGIEIFKSLKLESGAKITGNGIIILNKGVKVKGIDLYYKYKGKYHVIPSVVFDKIYEGHSSDYKPNFAYNSSLKAYVWVDEIRGGDPFQLELSKRFLTVENGKKEQLTLSGMKSGVKWSSEDKSIATVSSKGVVKGVGLGQTTITAKYKGKSYTCEVTVAEKGLNPSELHMDAGQEFFLTLVGTKLKKVSSSDSSVATVNKKLTVKAKGSGECTITALGADGNEYTCKVFVQ